MKLENLTETQLRVVDAYIVEHVMRLRVCGSYLDYESMDYPPVPYYTTDTAAAMELLENYEGWCLQRNQVTGRLVCEIGYDVEANEPDIPYAIVSAVLAAEGVKLEDILNPQNG